MKFPLAIVSLISLSLAQELSGIPGDLTTSEVYTYPVVVSQGGAVYTKTRVETYTGQATTTPTSGTATTVITVANSLATYTKTLVVTYSKAKSTTLTSVSTDNNTSNDVTTTKTISLEYDTYTKVLTGESSDFVSSSSEGAAICGALGLSGALVAVAVIFL